MKNILLSLTLLFFSSHTLAFLDIYSDIALAPFKAAMAPYDYAKTIPGSKSSSKSSYSYEFEAKSHESYSATSNSKVKYSYSSNSNWNF